MANENNNNNEGGSANDGNANSNDCGNDEANRNRNTNSGQKFKTPRVPKITFKGETADMNGQLFQTFVESRNKRQFTKTMEALERYVNKNCNFSEDMSSLFKFNGS